MKIHMETARRTGNISDTEVRIIGVAIESAVELGRQPVTGYPRILGQ